ncbi:MAG TPA: helicase C-terminal domain-containing protein, partial [Nocardioidaceae bacterium]|nr:helicase C-terminal domain-containing protein [Nocardioidaceae bacterium]
GAELSAHQTIKAEQETWGSLAQLIAEYETIAEVAQRDRWTVTDVRSDRSLVVRRQGRKRGGAVVLPATYVADHVDLGYAVTAHRAQGLTVDTAHVVVFDSTTRENLYVAMTRGRDSNVAYVVVNPADDNHGAPAAETPTAKTVLLGVLANSGAELSAHQTIKAEQETWGSLAQLIAEYETIAEVAQRDRWASLLRGSGLTSEQAQSAIESDAFGPLVAELRRAEANGHNIETLLPIAVARYGLGDADDIAAVLRHRIALSTRNVGTGRGRRPARLIVGLTPEALGPMASDMRKALDERRDLIEQRARALAEDAVRTKAPWTKALDLMPTDRADRARWVQAAITIAAYRDRYGITAPRPLGVATTDTHRIDRARAAAAIRRVETAVATASQPQARSGQEGIGW